MAMESAMRVGGGNITSFSTWERQSFVAKVLSLSQSNAVPRPWTLQMHICGEKMWLLPLTTATSFTRTFACAIAMFEDDDDASFAAQNELEPLNLSVNL